MILNYEPCHSCRTHVDDGKYREGKYLCHDCLDKKE